MVNRKRTKGKTTLYKTGDELRCSGRVAVPAPIVAPVVLKKGNILCCFFANAAIVSKEYILLILSYFPHYVPIHM